MAQVVKPNPIPTLPDLYEVLWTVVGCGLFCVAWFITVIKMYGGLINTVLLPATTTRRRVAPTTAGSPPDREIAESPKIQNNKAKED